MVYDKKIDASVSYEEKFYKKRWKCLGTFILFFSPSVFSGFFFLRLALLAIILVCLFMYKYLFFNSHWFYLLISLHDRHNMFFLYFQLRNKS